MGRNNVNFTSVRLNIPYEVRVLDQNPTYRKPAYPQRQTPQRQETPRQDYAEQSGRSEGGRYRVDPHIQRRPPAQSQEDFARGDRMPDFLRDDDDDPHKPPF
jgi:hypothetical protein